MKEQADNILTQKQLKNALKKMKKQELLNELMLLFDNYDDVRRHFEIKYASLNVQMRQYDRVCQIIKLEFDPPKGLPAARIDYIKSEIQDFKIKCSYPYLSACLHIYFSQMCFKYLVEYRDIVYDPLDRDVANSFIAFAKIISEIGCDKLTPDKINSIKEFLSCIESFDKKLHQKLLGVIDKYALPLL